MPFKPGQSGNLKGRPIGSQSGREKIIQLLGESNLHTAFIDDFNKGDKFARQIAFEHFFGKPIQENRNENLNVYSDGWELIFTRPQIEQKQEGMKLLTG